MQKYRNRVTRRDLLKLAGLLPLSMVAPRVASPFGGFAKAPGTAQNALIIVFDALSAKHLWLHGYPRETMPNLTRLADRAIVYHNNYAGGNFTSPGTASLLTGTHPWTHRAFLPGGRVPEELVPRNIFAAFDNYYRLSYSHNLWANLLLRQFRNDQDQYIPKKKYFLTYDDSGDEQDFFFSSDNIVPKLFGEDEDIALVSWIRAMEKQETGYAYSLFISSLYEQYRKNYYESRYADIETLFPRGIPRDDYDIFLLEHAIDAIGSLLTRTPQPFMGYFHFWPPHAPYNTHRDFYQRFTEDGYQPVKKPLDLFGDDGPKTKHRTEYDEYLLYVDREFGRFYDSLEMAGLLENTWIVLTSDHGEMFERGIEGHRTPVLYEPVIRVPLVIFEPGRTTREDIYSNTSAVDILPTLLQVTGQERVDWTEGIVLPPFAGAENSPVYVVHADKNEQLDPLRIATLAMIEGDYKLTYFFGYKELGTNGERVELYHLKEDPEELNDLFDSEVEIGSRMLEALKAKLSEVNAPYLPTSS